MVGIGKETDRRITVGHGIGVRTATAHLHQAEHCAGQGEDQDRAQDDRAPGIVQVGAEQIGSSGNGERENHVDRPIGCYANVQPRPLADRRQHVARQLAAGPWSRSTTVAG